MSELEEEQIVLEDTKPLEPLKRLSPTSINTWYKCPRAFYYQYITKEKVKPNIHLVKGSVVHKVLEDFYRAYNDKPKAYLKSLFKKAWKSNEKMIKSLEMPPEELIVHKQDAFRMTMDFHNLHQRKIDALVGIGKAENERHAFYLTKPKFREMWVEDKELHCAGFIDRIHEDFNGLITLGDYKTSSKFGIGLPEDYKRQLSIYALLYNNKEKLMPHFVAVIFLRYGEEFLLEVTPSLLTYARNTIQDVWARTRSAAIIDYPLREGKLCRWCAFQAICNGEEEFKKQKRIDDFKKLAKEEDKNGTNESKTE